MLLHQMEASLCARSVNQQVATGWWMDWPRWAISNVAERTGGRRRFRSGRGFPRRFCKLAETGARLFCRERREIGRWGL